MTIHTLPEATEAFRLARRTLRNSFSSHAAIVTACDVLDASDDYFDIRMVRNARLDIWERQFSTVATTPRGMFGFAVALLTLLIVASIIGGAVQAYASMQ